MELTVWFQTANGDGSTQVSLALILSLSLLHTPPAKATPHTQKTAIPSLLPAVPAEMDGKAQISSVKALVLSWSQLKLCAATRAALLQTSPGITEMKNLCYDLS